jgi:hypothetical protein
MLAASIVFWKERGDYWIEQLHVFGDVFWPTTFV